MSNFTKLPVANIPAEINDVFLHEYVLTKTDSCLVAYFTISSSCADLITVTDELTNDEQGSADENFNQERWNSTESRTVIIWDEGRSVTPPQEIEYVRIH